MEGMKASVSFRDERRPLVRLKLPVSLLGLPLCSAVSGGDASDLELRIATALPSGPSLRLSLRPNASSSPISVSLKSGLGPLGSPTSAPLTFSAHFYPFSSSPSFRLHIKPRLGDFTLRTSASSSSTDHDADDVISLRRKAVHLPSEALAGAEVTARTSLPLTRCAAVEIRWGVRIPAEARHPLDDEGKAQAPSLRMSKISVEHVAAHKEEKNVTRGETRADAADTWWVIQKQVNELREESWGLRRAVEEVRAARAGGGGGGRGAAEAAKGKIKVRTNAKVNDEMRRAVMEE